VVDSISNILPIQVVGTISGTTTSGLPTNIFSRANIEYVVIVNEDPIPVNLVSVSGTGPHGLLSGLENDDHPQYGVISGTETVTGSWTFTNVANITAVTGTFTQGLTVGTGTNYIFDNDVRFVDGTMQIGISAVDINGTLYMSDDVDLQGNNLYNADVVDAVRGDFSDYLTVSGVPVDIGGVTTDHGNLGGLGDDDHPQYMKDLVEDASPQLGGNLDAQSNDITNIGALTTVTGTFTQSLTVSGVPVDIVGSALTGAVESALAVVLSPADKDYPLEVYAEYPYTIIRSWQQTSAGSLVSSVKINGVVVEGMDNVTISGALESSTATSANSVAAGDRVLLSVSGTSSAADLEFGLRIVRT
jgi:hypothetical protein